MGKYRKLTSIYSILTPCIMLPLYEVNLVHKVVNRVVVGG